MNDKYLLAKNKLIQYSQEQLLKFYDKLDDIQKNELLEDILNTDFEQINKLYKDINKDTKNTENVIEPIPYIDKEKLSCEKRRYYENIGEDIIKKGKYAVVTMAGGQRNKAWT